MKVEVGIEEMRKKKLFIGTPMYGAMCGGQYTKSIADLTAMCAQYQIEVKLFYLFNESLITRARNYIADEFMRSGFTHLMFIDSDIGFDPNDVLALAAICEDGSDKDVVCGPYPKKCISWEKIKRAVDKGFADENPNKLEKYVGDYVFNPVGGANEMRVDQPAEVSEGGTGFMMITRKTFEEFDKSFPEQKYLPDHVRSKHFDGTREIMAYFDSVIDNKQFSMQRELPAYLSKNPDAKHEDILNFVKDQKNGELETYSKRYLSEDYMFCQWVRKIGLKVWMCPWMKLQHTGSYVFGGSLLDLATIGAAATADANEVKPQ